MEKEEVEQEENEKEAERCRRVRLSILQKLPRVTGPFVNEIESPVTVVPRRRNMYSLTERARGLRETRGESMHETAATNEATV